LSTYLANILVAGLGERAEMFYELGKIQLQVLFGTEVVNSIKFIDKHIFIIKTKHGRFIKI
jgi:hypothetical protein